MGSPRSKVEEWLDESFADPFIVPAREGRGARGGGAIDVRAPLAGGKIDFLEDPKGVFVLVELPEEAVELSCFVGDLLGDWNCELFRRLLGREYCNTNSTYCEPCDSSWPRSRRWTPSIDTPPLARCRIHDALPLSSPWTTHARRLALPC